MFKKANRIISNKVDLANYIEDIDVYNSALLTKLNDPTLSRSIYEITVYEYRPDLIAQDFYGSDDYTALVLVQNGVSLEAYTKGNTLTLIDPAALNNILSYM